MALVGPTGSGKTYTALKLALNLVDGPILIVDSERSSANRYADIFNADERIDHLDLPDFNPDTYVQALDLAAKNGYQAVVIDSLSHAWMGKEGALEQVDKFAKRGGNLGSSFNAWREVTPMHNRLVDAILSAPMHVIATMRVKTEYVVESVNGKSVPRKIGLSPVQRDGVEYEFDIVADLDQDNNLIVTKTRMASLGGQVVNKPGEKLALQIRDWCNTGEKMPEPVAKPQTQSSSRPASALDYRNVLRSWGASSEDWESWKEEVSRRTEAKPSELIIAASESGARDLDDAFRWLEANYPVPGSDAGDDQYSDDAGPKVSSAPSVENPGTPSTPPTSESPAETATSETVEATAEQWSALNALDSLLAADPEGKSALYASAFAKALELGAVDADGKRLVHEPAEDPKDPNGPTVPNAGETSTPSVASTAGSTASSDTPKVPDGKAAWGYVPKTWFRGAEGVKKAGAEEKGASWNEITKRLGAEAGDRSEIIVAAIWKAYGMPAGSADSIGAHVVAADFVANATDDQAASMLRSLGKVKANG